MRTVDVLNHFHTQKGVALALGMKQPSVAVWGEYPPDKRQLQIERLTKGKLKAEPGCRERALGLNIPTPKKARD